MIAPRTTYPSLNCGLILDCNFSYLKGAPGIAAGGTYGPWYWNNHNCSPAPVVDGDWAGGSPALPPGAEGIDWHDLSGGTYCAYGNTLDSHAYAAPGPGYHLRFTVWLKGAIDFGFNPTNVYVNNNICCQQWSQQWNDSGGGYHEYDYPDNTPVTNGWTFTIQDDPAATFTVISPTLTWINDVTGLPFGALPSANIYGGYQPKDCGLVLDCTFAYLKTAPGSPAGGTYGPWFWNNHNCSLAPVVDGDWMGRFGSPPSGTEGVDWHDLSGGTYCTFSNALDGHAYAAPGPGYHLRFTAWLKGAIDFGFNPGSAAVNVGNCCQQWSLQWNDSTGGFHQYDYADTAPVNNGWIFTIQDDAAANFTVISPTLTWINDVTGLPYDAGLPTASTSGGGSSVTNKPYCTTALVAARSGAGYMDPVNCATGDFWESVNDLAVPGRGIPLHFSRTYNSLSANQDSPVGFGWTDSYNATLSTDASGIITVTEANGSSVTFSPNRLGGYRAYNGVFAALVPNSDGTLSFTQDKDQQKLTFTTPTTATLGQLIALTDRNGYTTSLTYTNGLLSTITDPSGRALTISYNAAGRIARVSDPIGRTVAFTYDASGNATAVTDVGGGTTHYGYYAGTHLLQTITDPTGGTLTVAYDPFGRVTAVTDPLGQTATMTYTANTDGSQTTTMTDTRGIVTKEQYLNNELLSLTKGYGTPQASTWTYSYDPATLGIASATDPNGHTSYSTYDANGNLLSHTDALGRTTTYQYDALNDTTAITDPLGVTTVMTYDASGNLLQVARPLTQTGQTALTTLTYDPLHPGDVLTRTDPNGHTWRYSYDQYGALASSSDPLSDTTTYSYDPIGRRTSMVSPNGNVSGANPISYTTTYTYNAFGDLTALTDALGHVTTYQYDPNRNLTAVTDANGHATNYGYDLDNERTSTTRPDGGVWLTGYDPAGNLITQTDALSHTTTFAYDPLNRRISVTDPRGGVTLTAYDPAGNVISTTDPLSHTTLFGYDAANEHVSTTRPNGGVWLTGYDLDGRVITQTDALSATTLTTYDSLGRRLSVTDPLSRTTTYSDDLAGNVTATTDPNQHTTTYGYDAANRRTRVTRADGSLWLTAYDADSNVISTTDPLSHTTLHGYDVLDRLTSTTDPLSHTTTYAYDAVGNRLSVTDPLSHTTRDQYDALNRVILVTDPLTHSTLTAYDLAGNVVSTTDALSHTTSYGYDADNELVTTTLPGGATQLQSYDLAGNRLSQTDALGHVTTYGYDLDNRLVSLTDPLTRTWTYTYDLGDNRIDMGDPAGRVTTYGYDPDHELTSISYNAATTPNVAYTYTPSGQRASMSDGTGTTTYTYDALDRPITVTNGAGQTVGYGYDLAGNLTTLVYPDSSVITRTYDAANRLTGLMDWLGHTTSFYYDAADRLVAQTLPTTPTALTAVSYYNAANQLTGIQDTANGSVFWTFGYGRDAAGRLSSTLDPLAGYQAYSSDTLNRLSGDQANAPYTSTTAWGYDAASELTTLGYSGTYMLTDTFGYDPASELGSLRVQLNGTLTHNDVYTDTPNGDRAAVSDLVTGAAASYGWDQENRLISATNGITTSSYAYDGDGLRMSKVVSGTAEAFTWDTAEGLPLLLQDGGTRYIMGPDGTPVESIGVTGTVLYYLHDQLGSTRGLFTAAGQNVASYTYTPFGSVGLHTGSATTPLQYAGQYTDAETGWQYLQARYYDPATSQFVSVDPLASQTWQPYAYATDDPLNGVDPSGLFGHCPGLEFASPVGTHACTGPLSALTLWVASHVPQQAHHIAAWGRQANQQATQWVQTTPTGQMCDALVMQPVCTLQSSADFQAKAGAIFDLGLLAGGPDLGEFGVLGDAGDVAEVGSGSAYSVAYETKLPESAFPGVSRRLQNQVANTALIGDMETHPEFAQQMEELIPGLRDQLVSRRGNIGSVPPLGWTWHHAIEEGVMQLVPRVQHATPGQLQDLLHPGGTGGFAIWG